MQNDSFADDEFPAMYYIVILLRGWWAILAVIVISLALAATTSPPKPPDLFEARTNISIHSNASDSASADNGMSISLGLNQALATSDVTLLKVIQAADPRLTDLDQEVEYESLMAILVEEMTLLEVREPAAEITNIKVDPEIWTSS